MSEIKHAVIVGASSGIGREIALQLARSGTQVCAVARRQDLLEKLAAEGGAGIKFLVHDATDLTTTTDAFQSATQLAGGLDLFVYAAGSMPIVTWGVYDLAKDKQMVDVNVLGAVAWLNEAAARMESTKHGRLVCIGSVAGDRGRGEQPVYNASKAFQHTFMESLRNRLARYGVSVVTIKPGPVATEMTAHLDQSKMMSADVAARKIIALSNRTGEHYLKFTHKVIFAIIRSFPSALFRKLKV